MSSYVTKHGETIPSNMRSLISTRYQTVTRAVNVEFWNSSSNSAHSLYVGSYGRGTAIDTSDIDILVEVPESNYRRYDTLKGNGQSRLLQAVRNALLSSYPRTDIRADGQVVKVLFSDGMKMEVLPAFRKPSYISTMDEYTYPDTNNGGCWLSTNPKAEQEALRLKNNTSFGLLFDTCKHIRFIRDNYFSSYHLSGIVIDSFVFNAISGWQWTQDGDSSSTALGTYEESLLQKYYTIFPSKYYATIQAPGSNQTIDASSSVECLEKVLLFMAK